MFRVDASIFRFPRAVSRDVLCDSSTERKTLDDPRCHQMALTMSCATSRLVACPSRKLRNVIILEPQSLINYHNENESLRTWASDALWSNGEIQFGEWITSNRSTVPTALQGWSYISTATESKKSRAHRGPLVTFFSLFLQAGRKLRHTLETLSPCHVGKRDQITCPAERSSRSENCHDHSQELQHLALRERAIGGSRTGTPRTACCVSLKNTSGYSLDRRRIDSTSNTCVTHSPSRVRQNICLNACGSV